MNKKQVAIWVLNSVLIVLFTCYVIATWSWKWALAIPATILIVMYRKRKFHTTQQVSNR